MVRPVPKINTAPMAGIAFLLLIFILLNTNMSADYGIARLLPPITNKTEPTLINKRNVFIIHIDSKDNIKANGKLIQLYQLKDMVKEFYSNPTGNPNLSDKKEIDIPYFGIINVSKGIISISTDKETKYKAYIMVQDELTNAIDELRERVSEEKFRKPYIFLDSNQQDAIKKIYPISITEADIKNIGGNL